MSNTTLLTKDEFTTVLKDCQAIIEKYDIDLVEYDCSIENNLYVSWWMHNGKTLLVAGDADLHYRIVDRNEETIAQGNILYKGDFLDLYRRLFEWNPRKH